MSSAAAAAAAAASSASSHSPSLLLLLPLLVFVPVSVVLLVLLVLFFVARPRPVRVPLRGRHVLVTGGSSGIGLALARAAAAAGEGARVSLLARDPSRLSAAAAALGLPPAAALSADVRDPAAVARALAAAGPVDVLVCSHGVFVPRELETQSVDQIRDTIDINLMGTFHLIKAALPAMKARARETGLPAAIAIVSSQAGQVGVYGYTAYSASKFALRGLAEALQQEVIADNIHVSLIFPPDTETPGFAEEQKVRPELTSLIAGSSGAMKADDVAKKALDGIKRGAFFVSCNFDGIMLSIATAGLSPQRSFIMAFFEVLGAGLMRFIALCFQWNWYNTIEKWHSKKNR